MNRAALFMLLIGIVPGDLHAQDDGEDKTKPPWRDEFARQYEKPRDFGHDWKLGTLFAITPEDGILLGAGAILYEFGFRKAPYMYRMELVGGVSIPTLKYKFIYTLGMPALTERLFLDLASHASELEVRNFYGYGNATESDPSKDADNYYLVSAREFFLSPVLGYRIGKRRLGSISLGLSFKHFKLRSTENRSVADYSPDDLGENRPLVSAGVLLAIDSRDHAMVPHRGVNLSLTAWGTTDLKGEGGAFQKVSGELRTYLGDTLGRDMIIAFRAAGEKIFGQFPFYESAFLGGAKSLRGFPRERFAGDASAFGSVELRISAFRERLLIPTELGITLLADAGRVWTSGDSPGVWHSDAGVGLWLAPMSRDAILSFIMAKSVEGWFFNAHAGFGF